MSEWIRRFIFQVRGMWTAAGMVYDSQRDVLGMTIELARDVELRIKLKKENAALKQALTLIGDIGYDYDGYGKVDSLKKLIDEMVGYARNPQSAVDALTAEEQDCKS